MLNEGRTLCAWEFKGYWKDVGTIDSLWEANMDLLDDKNALNLSDPTWRIYTEDAAVLPQYIGPEAKIRRAYITQGVEVEGTVQNSVLFTNSRVGAGAKVIDSVLMPGAVVEEGATVTRAMVADGVRIGRGQSVGKKNSENILLVAENIKGKEE
jgi:glucose-1-phosphate adenylyltransferase